MAGVCLPDQIVKLEVGRVCLVYRFGSQHLVRQVLPTELDNVQQMLQEHLPCGWPNPGSREPEQERVLSPGAGVVCTNSKPVNALRMTINLLEEERAGSRSSEPQGQ